MSMLQENAVPAIMSPFLKAVISLSMFGSFADLALAIFLTATGAIQTDAETISSCMGAMKKRATPSGVAVLCTQAYDLQGPCNGSDAVYSVKIFGFPTQTDWKIRPWEAADSTIRGIELAQYKGGRIEWAMAGNNSVPDIMLMLATGQNYGRAVFPPGTGMPMPSKSTATEDDYLDLHIVCSGQPFGIWYKIEYTIP